uniref:Receptor expression-enhancing protein n=1 Tax=Panagrellus redivivus TaxID=6233 RepID=A0A7E4VLX4_PANRE
MATEKETPETVENPIKIKFLDTIPYEEAKNVFEYGLIYAFCAILYHINDITPLLLLIYPIAIGIGNYYKLRGFTDGIAYMMYFQNALTILGYCWAWKRFYPNVAASILGSLPLTTDLDWLIAMVAAFVPYLCSMMVYFGWGLYSYDPYKDEKKETGEVDGLEEVPLTAAENSNLVTEDLEKCCNIPMTLESIDP